MITEYELRKAIDECQSQPNPNANTCMKLASYITILDSMNKDERQSGYSFSGYQSGSEFGRIAMGKDADAVARLIDDLINTIQVVNPRLYDNFMDKLYSL